MSDTTIPSDTVQAYRETEYRVCGQPAFVLRIGQPSPELLQLQHAHQVQCSAFITACNPYSQPLQAAENRQRQGALVQQVRVAGYAVLSGVGQHPSNDWPGEESCLVLGIALDAAKALGNQHGQNAIVWCGADGSPELVLLQ